MSEFPSMTAERLRQIARKLRSYNDSFAGDDKECRLMAVDCERAAVALDAAGAITLTATEPRGSAARLAEEERKRIAGHLQTIATNLIKDAESDGIDGYTGAVILDLAQVIRRNGDLQDHKTFTS